MTTGKKVGIRAFAETFIVSVFVQLFTFLQGGLTARLLGPDGRGQLALIVLIPTLIASIGMFGTGRVIARDVVFGDEKLPSSLLLILFLSVTGMFFGVLFILVFYPEMKGDLLYSALMFLVYIPISQLNKLFDGIDQGHGTLRRFNVARMVINPMMAACLMVIYFMKYSSLQLIILVYLLCNLVPCMFRLLYMKQKLFGKPSYTVALDLFKRGMPYCFQTAFNEIYLRVDVFLVIIYLTDADLGIYSIGMASAIALQSITNSASIVVFARSVNEDKAHQSWHGTARLLRVCTLLKLFMSVILVLLLPFLIPLVYGDEFNNAVGLANILIWGNLFNGLGKLYDECLLGMGVPVKSLLVKICSSIVLIVVTLCLVSSYSLSAIAIGYFASKIVYWLLNMYCLTKQVGCKGLELVYIRLSDIKYILEIISKYVSSRKNRSLSVV